MKIIYITFLFASFCIFAQGFAEENNRAQKEIRCPNIEAVDFKDTTLALDESENISFSSGSACPVDPDTGRCCLEYTITADRLLQTDKQNTIKMVVINRNILCGSGYGDYLLFYSCANGRLKNILKKYYDGGVKVEENKNAGLVVTSGIWQEGDAHCCPSMEKIELYKWDSKSKSFLIKKTEIRAIKEH